MLTITFCARINFSINLTSEIMIQWGKVTGLWRTTMMWNWVGVNTLEVVGI